MTKYFQNNQIVRNYRRMWPFVRPYWARGLVGILLAIPVGALDAAIPALLKPVMDEGVTAQNTEFIRLMPFIIIGLAFLQGGLNYAATYVNAWFGSKVSMGVKRALYEKLLIMDTAYFDQRNSGEILMRYSSDPDLATGGLVANLKLFLTKFFSTIALIGTMFYYSWQLSALCLGIFVLAVYPVRYVKKRVKDISHKSLLASSSFLTIYNETFSGNKIINSFTLEGEFRSRFNRNLDSLFHLGIKMIQGSGWLSPLLHFIGAIGLALLVGLGFNYIIAGEMTFGDFAACSAAMLLLYTPLKSIGSNYVRMQQSFVSIERIYEILDSRPQVKSRQGDIQLEAIRRGVEFDRVSFGYTPERRVLREVSFTIGVGQTTALVGYSGGGKTTIGSLIPRLYDVGEGRILIDGLDIRDYTLESLRRNIAVVFQDNFLFSGTLRENLLFGNIHTTEEDMWRALASANLDEFVRSTEKGLDTVIGERGVLLSGGQKQRVAIARAFVKNAPLVILDEATSALDNKAEKVVQEALDNLMKDRTVIVIAHRLSTIQNADNILVVNDGRIAEQGRHADLMAAKGAYYALYAAQFADSEEERA